MVIALGQRQSGKARCTSAARGQKSKCRLTARRSRHKQIRYEWLLCSVGCGIRECIAKEHQKWYGCHGPHWSAADRRLSTIDWAFGKFGLRIDLVFPNFHKQREQVLNGADSTGTDIANCSIHFMMGDASNSGWLRISKLQAL